VTPIVVQAYRFALDRPRRRVVIWSGTPGGAVRGYWALAAVTATLAQREAERSYG